MSANTTEHYFTRYQVFLIAIISILQFTIVVDFMVMAPLGSMLMRVLTITPSQFGVAVSAYAFSAGISGIFAAGFADKFDRKKMLLFFYGGFCLGTFLCGIAPTFNFLLIGRIVTGMFGGVLGSITMAIIADMFPVHVRGRVMGYTQMSFSVSSVVGIPLGIYLANEFGWHSPFLMIVGFCVFLSIAIIVWMQPVRGHLEAASERSAFAHLVSTLKQRHYMRAFTGTAFLSAGGFLLMPFSSAFMVHNIGIPETNLPVIFLVTGLVGMVLGPLIGKWSDAVGKYKMFLIGSVLAGVMVVIYTHLSITPLWEMIALNTILFAGVSSRIIPMFALISAMPDMKDRGAFMSINASIQQMGGGIASVIGGYIVGQSADGMILNYDILGYVTLIALVACGVQLSFVDKYVAQKNLQHAANTQPAVVIAAE